MAPTKILVLGGTGPTGINLLRELIYRELSTVVYARSPSKIPSEISSSQYVEIVKGEFTPEDNHLLSQAISQCSAVISLLGPVMGDFWNQTPTFFADIYRQQILPLMAKQSVPRILAMSTVSVYRPEDSFHFFRWLNTILIKLLASAAQKDMRAIEATFVDGDQSIQSLDWTVYRMVLALGGCDEESWRNDRVDGEMYAGPVGAQGFTMVHRRAHLAKWLVDAALNESGKLTHTVPAVSRLAGSKRKAV